MKKEIQNILKYYLEYEISNILNSSELKISKNSIILSKERLQNIRNIKQELRNIKEKTLENFIYKLCDIIQSQEFYLYSHYITYINNQNQNYQEVKNLPIFIFNCEIDEENIKILEVNVNPETLNIILSVILKKDITEVVLDYGDEIENYRKEIINTIDGGDIFHLIDLYYSKLEEYTTISKEQIKNIYKKNRNYRMNEEYIITLDELASQSIKNIKEDIEALIEIIKNDNYVPKILDKYLENQEVNKKDIDDTNYQKPYLGNYKNEYGVSQIQYEIVNAIKDNDITAIEGPPGTGKTSLLKEIIANNIVERANL